ncbi:probable maltase [Uranotaenia lowii]|uniref:probable maltase n=1 Tax=Uranotaenia lowii TaxID=190385 RepID=UPI002479BE0B|nr:probable maltase [Uranotaenia lowii]
MGKITFAVVCTLVCFGFGIVLGADDNWWQHANFYQIYPRSFMDSDGDGIGDLPGITQKVSYLRNELGIDAVWLSPIFKSPMADFGYDISDFRDIYEKFGTIADLENLASECKRQGLKLILDFVPNHSSDEHDYFVKSVNKVDPYTDYYVWHPGKLLPNGTRVPPSNWISIFIGSAWEWNDVRKEYYLHQFLKKQPDLNYRNPLVVQEMKDVLRYWLDKGVDGFRVDALPFLYEAEVGSDGNYPDEAKSGNSQDPTNSDYLYHNLTQNLDETFDMIYQWREVLEEFKTDTGRTEDVVLMIEAYTPLENIIRLYGDDATGREGAQIPFNFEVLSNIFRDSNGKKFHDMVMRFWNAKPDGRYANWVLGNHDNKRLASRLGVKRADLYNIALNTLPDVAVTYNGEELGMEDVYIPWSETIDPAACNSNPQDFMKYSRDPARTPMLWDSSTSAGFSTSSTTWLPVAANYESVNYEVQKSASRSHVKIFKSLLRLRKQRTLREGTFEMKLLDDDLLIIRRHLAGVSTVVSILNFHKGTRTVNLSQAFEGLPLEFEIITSSLQTNYIDGSVVDRDNISLPGEAAIVLEGNVANGV